MKLFKLNVLLIIFQICFVIAPKVIEPIEDDNSKLLDSSSSLESSNPESNGKDDELPSNETLQEDNESAVVTPSKITKPNIPKRIPMTCINNVAEYCRNKFEGFRFRDGCHRCHCTKTKPDICGTGPCEFYADSYTHALTYCFNIIAQNKKNYEDQMKDRILNKKQKENESNLKPAKTKIRKNDMEKEKVNNIKEEIVNIKNINKTKLELESLNLQKKFLNDQYDIKDNKQTSEKEIQDEKENTLNSENIKPSKKEFQKRKGNTLNLKNNISSEKGIQNNNENTLDLKNNKPSERKIQKNKDNTLNLKNSKPSEKVIQKKKESYSNSEKSKSLNFHLENPFEKTITKKTLNNKSLEQIESPNFFSEENEDNVKNPNKNIEKNENSNIAQPIPKILKEDANEIVKKNNPNKIKDENPNAVFNNTILNNKERVDVKNEKKKNNKSIKTRILSDIKINNTGTTFPKSQSKSGFRQSVSHGIKIGEKNSIGNHLKGGKKIIQDKINPIQSSLAKLTDQKILKKIIYIIAYNELSIKRILRKMKKEPKKGKVWKLFMTRLKEIHDENSMYKTKILEVVKMKLKLTKSNFGPYDHSFNIVFLNKIAKKVNLLNEELHGMKGGLKMWIKTSKKVLESHKSYYDGGYGLHISVLTVTFCGMVTFILRK